MPELNPPRTAPNVLITGGAGFFGGVLKRRLLAEGEGILHRTPILALQALHKIQAILQLLKLLGIQVASQME